MSGNTLGSVVKWLFLLGGGARIRAPREAQDFRVEEWFPVDCAKWKESFRAEVKDRSIGLPTYIRPRRVCPARQGKMQSLQSTGGCL